MADGQVQLAYTEWTLVELGGAPVEVGPDQRPLQLVLDLEEAHVKRAMVEASADVIALATVDKLRSGSAYLVAPVAELTHVVVEASADDELLDPYRAIGVTVTRA